MRWILKRFGVISTVSLKAILCFASNACASSILISSDAYNSFYFLNAPTATSCTGMDGNAVCSITRSARLCIVGR